MQLKKLISNNAHWAINKSLAKDIGLEATILLQHFIDLQSSFFQDGGFYQQQDRLLEDLPITIDYLRKATKLLVSRGFISVVKKGIPAKNHYTVHDEYILSYLAGITSSTSEVSLEISKKDDKESIRDTTNTKNINTKNKETNNRVLDVPSEDDIKGKIFFKIVELYPKNRIGNRQHALKKFKTLDINQAKLAAVNLKRYLKVAGTYIKNLQNYITEECYTEAWLKPEETKSKPKDITNTKEFDTNY